MRPLVNAVSNAEVPFLPSPVISDGLAADPAGILYVADSSGLIYSVQGNLPLGNSGYARRSSSVSRGAASEGSPPRELWVVDGGRASPGRGDRASNFGQTTASVALLGFRRLGRVTPGRHPGLLSAAPPALRHKAGATTRPLAPYCASLNNAPWDGWSAQEVPFQGFGIRAVDCPGRKQTSHPLRGGIKPIPQSMLHKEGHTFPPRSRC